METENEDRYSITLYDQHGERHTFDIEYEAMVKILAPIARRCVTKGGRSFDLAKKKVWSMSAVLPITEY